MGYFKEIRLVLKNVLKESEDKIAKLSKEEKEFKDYLWENLAL